MQGSDVQILPEYIPALFHRFHAKKWEKFNSEKVCHISYARIQGKSSLVTHFQNSSLLHEDKRCRPIIFRTDGNVAGEQEPFPAGPNVSATYDFLRHANGLLCLCPLPVFVVRHQIVVHPM